ncbi:PDR/VanB family oxidoreductase [Hoyosella subflava]|uniref:Putative iron-sulfur oxidoreductase n=1 Tax=Hoyosella subflava (strain DSM 45089 / JCM 17490 / NBRC 109087 / DQS3-9A1) TaxID=443218 RepID=F6EFM8_HOYSD|nr:PDR/VanB family oxidoreductase [Hoyosella subflava]AEF40957.1 Putative iron-sulfur oxidoreductase [Hoyosella subflava DQS3-9A1]
MNEPVESASVRHTLRVKQKTWEADGVISLSLVDPSGRPLPTWEPGAHVSLRLPNGLVREYSLCSSPHDPFVWTVAVLRTPDSRGGSSYVHETLSVGELVEVEGPRNAFHLEEARRHVLIAGGIGITPILAMARRLEESGAEWTMLYTGRARSTMAFADEVKSFGSEKVTIHADDEAGGAYPDIRGMLHALDPTSLVYCCGPEPLLQAVSDAMTNASLLRVERFKAPERTAADDESSTSFDILCERSGTRVPVAENESVLDALTGAGVEVESSCTEGICGTCEVRVLRGDVDHRDFLMSPEEHEAEGTMFVCVSRCRSKELVLDL